jgi:phenylpropionate dioxygenase-like ring-hydroxylating dioxygenase large terminal subunit
VYHGWSYDLAGNLTGVAFERGVKRQGGMPEDFKRSEHNLRKLRVAEFSGLVFGSFDEHAPDFESYLGTEIAARIRRVLKRPVKVLGRTTQVLPNNWKLYFENVKDSYHASILHLFFTTFEINRLNQKGGIIIDDSGGHPQLFGCGSGSRQRRLQAASCGRADEYRQKMPALLMLSQLGDAP